MKENVRETKEANELAEQIRYALPLLQKALWSSFRLETGSFTLSLRWDKECEGIKISGFVDSSGDFCKSDTE